jgi:hypothetical protein
MIAKKDIDNVRQIMEKSKRFAETEEDKKRLKDIIEGFEDVAARYMQEVNTNAGL